MWRWRYVEPVADGEAVVLTGNTDYPDRQRAHEAVQTAYPGVSIQPGQAPQGLEVPVDRLPGPLARALAVAAWLLPVVVRALRARRRR